MSLPYIDKTGTGSTKNSIVFGSNASSTDDYYKNNFIYINKQGSLITGYTGSTKTAIISTSLTDAPGVGIPYIITGEDVGVKFIGGAGSGSTTTSVVLSTGAETTDGAYIGKYLTLNQQAVNISAYTGSSLTATTSALSSAPVAAQVIVISDGDPTSGLNGGGGGSNFYGLDTTFIGGNTNFEIALVVCLIVISISCVVLILFLLWSGKKGGGGDGGDGGGLKTEVIQQPPITLNLSTAPTYYPPTFRN
jgi:hypothetical protein